MKISTEITKVTPQIAAQFLATNTRNRRLKKHWVEQLKERMVSGQWVLNGESISFDKNGVLLNGQNRLTAVIESGVTVEMIVVRGLEPEAFSTIDENVRRNGKDVLYINGEKHASSLAALLRNIAQYEEKGKLLSSTHHFSNQDALDTLKSHPDSRESAAFGNLFNNKFKCITPSVTAFSHYLFMKISRDDTAKFFDSINEGVGLEKGSPILKLRDKLIYSHSSARARLKNFVWIHYVIKTWNYYRDGKMIKNLQIVKDEKFPIPR
jgi:hypothetical protein